MSARSASAQNPQPSSVNNSARTVLPVGSGKFIFGASEQKINNNGNSNNFFIIAIISKRRFKSIFLRRGQLAASEGR